ncbi:MAG: hypothetical protein A2017_21310 [Lentisphaerae bacterium GWF2_44_16]|nr:MAG: hypothetical protein A2017_21310 [Lentisphaerae bacterium GWF2_44_16]
MKNKVKAILVHIGMNMWEDSQPKHFEKDYLKERMYCPSLQFNEECWDTMLKSMSEYGLNMIVLDLGDGIIYKSHPELAVKGAWSPKKLKEELKRIKGFGIEPIPKMNFSTCHDTWLGIYSRMVSTPSYYQCCRELISEVTELFSSPRFFHVGMDEENFENQKFYDYQTVRSGNLWWDDLNFYFEQIKVNGMRSWMWSDVLWNCDENLFRNRVPIDVLQSNWYYGKNFYNLEPESATFKAVNAYSKLDQLGYEQIPTASNWSNDDNLSMTVEYCNKNLNGKSLLGFMTAPWYPTKNKYCLRIVNAIKQFPEI